MSKRKNASIIEVIRHSKNNGFYRVLDVVSTYKSKDSTKKRFNRKHGKNFWTGKNFNNRGNK